MTILNVREIDHHLVADEIDALLLEAKVDTYKWMQIARLLDEILRKADCLEQELEWHEDQLLFVELEKEEAT